MTAVADVTVPRPRERALAWLSRYGVALAAVIIAATLRWWLEKMTGPMPPFLTFYPAVLLVAIVSGVGPAIFATIVSALVADYFFIQPIGQFGIRYPGDMLALGIFTGTNVLLSILSARVRTARVRDLLLRRTQASQQLLRLFVENTPAPVAMFDTQMRYLATSNRWLEDYSLRSASIIGRSHYEVFPEIPEGWKQVHRRCLAGVVEKSAEDAFPRADGNTDWIRWEVHPWRTETGAIGGIIIFSENITERKNSEQRLKDLNEELAEQVRMRTAALAEREVMLQEIHHRVKNNLQLISSLMNSQAQNLESRSARAALESCQSRVYTMALIHEALYEYQDYAHVPFSAYARGLAENVFHACDAPASGTTLELVIDEGVSVDVEKAIPCGLILSELITNALKHAFPDSRRGILRVEIHQQPDHRVLICVADNGVGYTPEDAAETSSSMGLALVSTLTRQLGGTLAARSDSGTTVRIEFDPGARM